MGIVHEIRNFEIKYDEALKNLKNINKISLKSLKDKLTEEERKYNKMMKPCYSKDIPTKVNSRIAYSYDLSKSDKYISMLNSLITLKGELRGIKDKKKINKTLDKYLSSDDVYFINELSNLDTYLNLRR